MQSICLSRRPIPWVDALALAQSAVPLPAQTATGSLRGVIRAPDVEVSGFNPGLGFTGPRALPEIETVEVLEGPRAALSEHSEPGGQIHRPTKRPTFAPSMHGRPE